MEITLTKTFYKLECLSAVADEFNDHIAVIVKSETPDNFSVRLNYLKSDFGEHQIVEKFLNRFLDISTLENFT